MINATDILTDGIFAAIAGIGFASISNPPHSAFSACAILSALGHATRFCLMTYYGIRIAFASLVGAIVIGILGIPMARRVECPVEACTLPSLLPMVPGMYAYRSVQALLNCLQVSEETQFIHNLYLLNYNLLTCLFTILLMGIGATIPTFILRKK